MLILTDEILKRAAELAGITEKKARACGAAGVDREEAGERLAALGGKEPGLRGARRRR